MSNKGLTILEVIVSLCLVTLIGFLTGLVIYQFQQKLNLSGPRIFIATPATSTPSQDFGFTIGTTTAGGAFGSSTLAIYGSTTIQTWNNTAHALDILNAATSSVFSVNTLSGSTTVLSLVISGAGLASCSQALETLADGTVICGTDATGGGGGSGNTTWEITNTNFLAPTTTLSVMLGRTSSQAPLNFSSLFSVYATSTQGPLIFASSTQGMTGNFLTFATATGATVFSVTPTGGFIGTASSTIDAAFAVNGAFTIDSTGSFSASTTVAVDSIAVDDLTAGSFVMGGGNGSPLTALALTTNGQLFIGDGAGAPAAATLTATANETDITNGAGSITIGIVATPFFSSGFIGQASSTVVENFTVGGLLNVDSTTATSTFDYRVYIATSTPDTPENAALYIGGKLIVDNGGTGTTTVTVGDIGNRGCIQIRDSDDAGWTRIYFLNGVQTTETGTCE